MRKRLGGPQAFMVSMSPRQSIRQPIPGVTAIESAADQDSPMPFEEFFEQEHGHVFAAVWLITRNRHEAEEVMQDAFLRIWQRWEQVARLDNPTGYLYRTAMNVVRSRSRRASIAMRKAVRHMPPDDLLAAVEDRDELVRTLAPLSPRQRAAVVMTDVLGFTSEEAGEALGVSGATVRVLAKRGRDALRKELGGNDD